jgi:hypothetical protein
MEDLRLVEGETGDGSALAVSALEAVGAVAPPASRLENPSARGLRATG